MKFRNHQLPNGLQIVAECNDAAHTSSLGFFVQAGSRDEDDAIAGVSHFLEHMMFKGTASRSADDVNRDDERALRQAIARGEQHFDCLAQQALGCHARGGEAATAAVERLLTADAAVCAG